MYFKCHNYTHTYFTANRIFQYITGFRQQDACTTIYLKLYQKQPKIRLIENKINISRGCATLAIFYPTSYVISMHCSCCDGLVFVLYLHVPRVWPVNLSGNNVFKIVPYWKPIFWTRMLYSGKFRCILVACTFRNRLKITVKKRIDFLLHLWTLYFLKSTSVLCTGLYRW